jgi:transcriptional regulator with XRE-family HTH domain
LACPFLASRLACPGSGPPESRHYRFPESDRQPFSILRRWPDHAVIGGCLERHPPSVPETSAVWHRSEIARAMVPVGLRSRTSPVVRQKESEVIFMELSKRIRDLRYAKGWGPDELASRAKISRTALYQIERGNTSKPQAGTLRRISRALGVPLERRPASPRPTGRRSCWRNSGCSWPRRWPRESPGSSRSRSGSCRSSHRRRPEIVPATHRPTRWRRSAGPALLAPVRPCERGHQASGERASLHASPHPLRTQRGTCALEEDRLGAGHCRPTPAHG